MNFYLRRTAVDIVTTPTISLAGGVSTAIYTPLVNERNKPPIISSVVITVGGILQYGTTLTATIVGAPVGPFASATPQYQWYKIETEQGGVLTPIAGATSSQYVLQAMDALRYIVCGARFVQVGGFNTLSPWMYSEMTERVGYIADGDVTFAWQDFFNIENAVSIPANWNEAGVDVALINIGTAANWTAISATKPFYDSATGEMVFTKANSHKIKKETSVTHPPVFEVWIKGKYTATIGNMLSLGNQQLFGMDSSTRFTSNGLAPQTGDLNQHVFRLKFNGISSSFQVDKGTEVAFDENTPLGTIMQLGITQSGSAPSSFKIKRFQKSANSTFLTSQQVLDKWAFHGY